MRPSALIPALLIGTMSVLAACQSAPYYKALETVGIEKRDLLIDRVQDVRGAQRQAQEAFRGALTVYRETSDADPRNIAGAYGRLEGAYDKARDRSGDVEKNIEAMKKVADDMFADWEGELKLFQDPDIRAASAADLERTRTDYAALERTLDESVQRMDPALFTMRDRVLYLKNNQTPAALQQLRAQQDRLAADIAAVDSDLTAARAAAERFLTGLGG